MAPDTTAHTLFKRQFGHPPVHEVRVPAALVMLGRAATQTQGLVLAAAVDQYFHLALAPRSDGKIELICNAAANRESFWVSNLASNPQTPWADVPKSVLFQLRKRGVPFSGFNAAIRSDSVLETLESRSAPAALAVATAFGVRVLHPFSLTETGLARPPQRDAQGRIPAPGLAERLHLAALCSRALPLLPDGFVQAAAAACAKAWHVLTLDLRDRTAEHLPLVGEILALSFPEKASGPTGDMISRLLSGAARKLGLNSWRSVEAQFLDSVRQKIPMKAFAAAKAAVNDHFLSVAAERVLRSDDHALFGQYLQRSEENWRAVTGPLSHRQRIVVEIAKAHPACLAAVILPQVPGAVLHLVRHHLAPHFEQQLTSHFRALTGEPLKTVICQPVDGAA
jgi:galactokinase